MRLEPVNKHAEKLVGDAFGYVEQYRRTKNQKHLSAASVNLDTARNEDPEYLPALYGRAIVDDLTGRSVDAIKVFEQVLAERPPFLDEVEFQLGVAHYHQFDSVNLDKAINHLGNVAERTSDSLLQCRARAALVQAFGMKMVPPDPRDPNLEEINHFSNLLRQQCEVAETCLKRLDRVDEIALAQLSSGLRNAKALALMYRSDFFGAKEEKSVLLRQALQELELADGDSPNDWAIQCNIGSASMRLGHWAASERSFLSAHARLTNVLEHLRPNYGFALYELGRVCRLQGVFVKAIDYFDDALAIPYEYRGVSNRRLSLEKERAQHSSKEYP